MNVSGSGLQKVPLLVRQLQESECPDHFDQSEVHLIVAQDESVQWSPNIPCCQHFRETVQQMIEAHNATLREKTRLVRIRPNAGAIPDMQLFSTAVATAGDVYCSEHGQHVSLDTLVQGLAAISACCGRALDIAEQRLLKLG